MYERVLNTPLDFISYIEKISKPMDQSIIPDYIKEITENNYNTFMKEVPVI